MQGRDANVRRAGLLAALWATLAGAPLAAQDFGQSKVQFRTFAFKIIQTEHFEVFYYDEERAAALDAARMAERAYARMSRVLNHQFRSRKPIILYASHSHFQQTNAIPSDINEATEGVTEFFKHRMVLPFTGSYAEFEHVLQHELAHQFQYDIYSHGQPGAGVQTLVAVNPPGWFIEGMAEYLSVGPIDANTAMWLRDAALEGRLPTIEQMTYDPSVFPYRFGHALWSYIGERWGDEAVGAVLQSSVATGIAGAFQRHLGLSMEELSEDWRDAIQATYLPLVANHYRARRVARPLLTEERTGGSLNVAPALSPDGRRIVFFGQRNGFFVNLWLADAETGRVLTRLVNSAFNSDYESLRFIYSSVAFSPDGRFLAIATKHKDRDDLVILDIEREREERRIKVPLHGLTAPAWSPDGRRLVFTGYDGGVADLYVVNRDGTGLRALTRDKYAELHAAWSPDGSTVAFTTDRGPETDFQQLAFSNLRLALYHLESGVIEVLGHMEDGKNINPVWAPDGRSLAFISDRTGMSNVFLYDFGDAQIYQLTDVFTGVSGITALSPALSWARQADRLAFAYYEKGNFHVYTVDDPRSLKRAPYRRPETPEPVASLMGRLAPAPPPAAVTTLALAPAPESVAPAAAAAPAEPSGASVYRSPQGFRASGAAPLRGDSTAPAAGPVSVRQLLDSATLALPDTAEFTFRRYRVRYSADYLARPTLGYQRDNFGRGFFGGTSVSLSDILGDHTLLFAGAIDGRLSEAQVLVAYLNQRRRMNWAIGASQSPSYAYAPSTAVRVDLEAPGAPTDSGYVVTTRLVRYVTRDVFGQIYYPLNRFRRIELGVRGVLIDQDYLEQDELVDDFGRFLGAQPARVIDAATIDYVQPYLASVQDNAMFGWVGPFAGGRSRIQVAPTFGTWQFTGLLVDVRRYLWARPFTLAIRGLAWGRVGRDADLFPAFMGSTELIRGYTASSLRDHECRVQYDPRSRSGCPELDQLIGSKIAVANIELRFPLTRSLVLGLLPVGLPPIEGAVFFDAGVAWDQNSGVAWSREPGDDFLQVRAPLKSWGGSIRTNLLGFLILRFDYTKPLDRSYDKAYWTVSFGPTF